MAERIDTGAASTRIERYSIARFRGRRRGREPTSSGARSADRVAGLSSVAARQLSQWRRHEICDRHRGPRWERSGQQGDEPRSVVDACTRARARDARPKHRAAHGAAAASRRDAASAPEDREVP
jgi:hypothetical protein